MQATEHIINVDEQGNLVFIYSDELTCLFDLGETIIRRASHVEPTPEGLWEADMSPSNGPVLGPFTLRQEALDSEVAWLKTNILEVSNV